MVSCDNAHCLVEWYHFPCVGLAAEVSASTYLTNPLIVFN